MKTAGRPLRFLVLVFGAWIGLRTWQLWPDPPAPAPAAVRALARRPSLAQAARPAAVILAPPGRAAATIAADRPSSRTTRAQRAVAEITTIAPAAERPAVPAARAAAPPAPTLGLLGTIRYGTPAPPPAGARRWAASGWALLRGSGAGGGVATPQLGGSQAGVRIARTLDAQRRVAIVARFAAALDTRQQEAAIGLEWRPLALPVRVVAERRLGIANQRGGSALGLLGGVSDQSLPGGFRLDGYAQAGAVFRDRADGYGDGALHVTRRMLSSESGATIALGLGVWGGAQRDAQRLDIGPAAGIDVPLGAAQRLRIAVEWRQRIAGGAQPASGPALSIGTDY